MRRNQIVNHMTTFRYRLPVGGREFFLDVERVDVVVGRVEESLVESYRRLPSSSNLDQDPGLEAWIFFRNTQPQGNTELDGFFGEQNERNAHETTDEWRSVRSDPAQDASRVTQGLSDCREGNMLVLLQPCFEKYEVFATTDDFCVEIASCRSRRAVALDQSPIVHFGQFALDMAVALTSGLLRNKVRRCVDTNVFLSLERVEFLVCVRNERTHLNSERSAKTDVTVSTFIFIVFEVGL